MWTLLHVGKFFTEVRLGGEMLDSELSVCEY